MGKRRVTVGILDSPVYFQVFLSVCRGEDTPKKVSEYLDKGYKQVSEYVGRLYEEGLLIRKASIPLSETALKKLKKNHFGRISVWRYEPNPKAIMAVNLLLISDKGAVGLHRKILDVAKTFPHLERFCSDFLLKEATHMPWFRPSVRFNSELISSGNGPVRIREHNFHRAGISKTTVSKGSTIRQLAFASLASVTSEDKRAKLSEEENKEIDRYVSTFFSQVAVQLNKNVSTSPKDVLRWLRSGTRPLTKKELSQLTRTSRTRYRKNAIRPIYDKTGFPINVPNIVVYSKN